jgi:site-specific DNA-methyltransferase (adenine-specific)
MAIAVEAYHYKFTIPMTALKPALACADSLQYIKSMPDDSVDLILTDPPYFGVKAVKWDNQWSTDEEYLAWLDEYLSAFRRILKPNGSLYMFSGSRLAAKAELLTAGRFNVLNHVIWAKPSGMWRRQHKENLRQFFPATERIIFAEHYGADAVAKGQAGYAAKCEGLHKETFTPLIEYFSQARKLLNVSATEINRATGKQMCSHWFSSSQWRLPLFDDYVKLYELFKRKSEEQGVPCPFDKGYEDASSLYKTLNDKYNNLKVKYDSLKVKFEELRRPFSVTSDVPYTDVWVFAPVEHYPGKHPCEKPSALIEHIIRSSSRPGDVVADFFMGSGSTIKAAVKLNRRSIGVEVDPDRFEQTGKEIDSLLAELKNEFV